MAETSTLTYTDKLSQAGGVQSAAWVESTADSNRIRGLVTSPFVQGLIFDFSGLYSTDSLGRPLDPPGLEPVKISVTTVFAITFQVDVEIYMEVTGSPVAYSSGNLPGDSGRDEVLVCTRTLDTSISSDTTLEFELGREHTLATDTWADNPTYKANLDKVRAAFARSNTSGQLAMAFQSTGGAGPAYHDATVSGSEPAFRVNQWNFHTGHNKSSPGDRAVHDQRSGRAVGASNLQEDGFREGFWVTSDWWEKQDIRRTPPDLPDTERDRLDEVPE